MENLLNIDTDNTMFMQFKNQGTIRSDEDKSNSNMYEKSNFSSLFIKSLFYSYFYLYYIKKKN